MKDNYVVYYRTTAGKTWGEDIKADSPKDAAKKLKQNKRAMKTFDGVAFVVDRKGEHTFLNDKIAKKKIDGRKYHYSESKPTKKFNGVTYELRRNTADGISKKKLEELAIYGKNKGLISNYRIVKEGKNYRLYILSANK